MSVYAKSVLQPFSIWRNIRAKINKMWIIRSVFWTNNEIIQIKSFSELLEYTHETPVEKNRIVLQYNSEYWITGSNSCSDQ